MGSLSFWQERLQLHGIQVKRDERFGRAMLLFTDYDGIELALVETEQMVSLQDWAGQDVPHKHIIRHMFGVSIGVQSADPTVQVLQEGLGYEQQDRDEEEELSWKRELQDQGLLVTDVRDRQYFKSIYFREPGGTLFEIATDPPGFTWDESEEKLGQALKLINFKFLTLSFIC